VVQVLVGLIAIIPAMVLASVVSLCQLMLSGLMFLLDLAKPIAGIANKAKAPRANPNLVIFAY